MKLKKKVSIVIPVLNEEGNVKLLVARVHKALTSAHISYELIFIDDHSTDETAKAVKKLTKKYPVRLYTKKGLKGKAQSLLEGFKLAKYELIGMIDADLQYRPEALPEMVNKISADADIIIANRREFNASLRRKVISRAFSWFFGKFLHGFNCDVQSGLKVFRKEIIKRLTLHPSPWTFDLEFLTKARNIGYKIKCVDIVFQKRNWGVAKIDLVSASFQIGWSALKLRLKGSEIVPFDKTLQKKYGRGFHYKGIRFIHHGQLPPYETAFRRLNKPQARIFAAIVFVLIAGFIITWHTTLVAIVAVLSVLYFVDALFNLYLIYQSFINPPEIRISTNEIEALGKHNWPTYTVLCPLYKETEVLPQFIKAVNNLDYPKNKLQVLLLLESDDKDTIKLVKDLNLDKRFQLEIIPHSVPKTKPKALNFGLSKATGEYCVIYDAEDKPDKLQLKKAVIAFSKAGKKTICIQAKLNFYNPHQNFLTRVFTAEYSLWFDLILTGLQSIGAPIPLGGTSNHFHTKDLRMLKGWDAFNVTEDCDLGMRLVKNGFNTAIMDSTTCEEANSNILNWFRQRTRWIKGYIQTYLVHMRRPGEFASDLKNPHIVTFQLVVGGKVLSMLINPMMWFLTILYFSARSTTGAFIQSLFPGAIFYIAVLSAIFGNFLYLYYYMVGCARRSQWSLIKFVFLVPFYWLFMSISAWLAVLQIIRKPHYWPKTIHGFHLEPKASYATTPVYAKLSDSKLKTWSKKTLTSGTLLVASMMLANFFNFLFNAFLGRTLTFEQFGLVNIVNTLWYLVGIPFSSLGSTVNHRTAYLSAKVGKQASVRFLHQTRLRSAIIALFLSLIWILLSPVIADFFHIPYVTVLIFTPSMLALVSAVNTGFLQGSFYFTRLAIIFVCESGLKLLMTFILVRSNLHDYVYIAIPLSILLSYLLSFYITVRLEGKSEDKAVYGFPKRFYTASLLAGLATQVFLTVDVILTKHFLSATLAGEYAVLSLVGKMVFFFGSIPNMFMISFVSRDEGAGRNPNTTFHRLFLATVFTTILTFLALGPLGHVTVPFLFGAKTAAIIPYLLEYSLALALITLSNAIVIYHLSRKQYLFPVMAIFMSFIMCLGIIKNHNSIFQIINVLLIVAITTLILMLLLHFLQKNGKFVVQNLIVLVDLFFPLKPIPVNNTSKKKILIFNWRDTKHKYSGGAEVYIHELAKQWAHQGNCVTLFCGNDSLSPRNECVDGVCVIRRGGFYLVYFWAFLYYILRFRGRYDIIIDSENGIPFFTPLYVREPVICLVHHIHQEVFRKYLSWPLSFIALILENRLMPWVYRNTKYITVSQSTKKAMRNLGIGNGSIEVIHPGVDLKKFVPGKKSIKPLVIYVGRLKFYKSLDIFIKSAVQILKKVPATRFVIAGEGEERDGLENLAKSLNIADKITFLGKISEAGKISLYQKAWVFVNPSFIEGWGITSVEANACATPVVAADVPGLKDSVNNPHDGFLVAHGDIQGFSEKVTYLLKNKKIRNKMSKNSVKWAAHFNWEKSAKKFSKLLEKKYEKKT